MRQALLVASLAVAALLPSATPAAAAIPDEDTVEATGPNCVRPVEIPQLDNVFDHAWSPDGWTIAIVRILRIPAAEHVSGYKELEILETLDLRTGKMRHLGEGTRPAWSASGRYLSYWGPEADFLFVVEGERMRGQLTPSVPEYGWEGERLIYIEKSTLRAWDGEPTTIRKLGFTEIPTYPTDDVYWSGDGSLYTMATYDSEKTEPKRTLGDTANAGLKPLELPGALLTEWSPRGSTLLVRYPGRIDLRDGAGPVLGSVAVPSGGVHQWGADGRSLLLWTSRPGAAAGEKFEDVRVVWPSAGVMKLPDLAGPRGFSPNGRFFSGTVRTGRHDNRLVVYRCLLLATGEPQPDPQLGARAASLDSGTGRLIRPAHGPISQFKERGHTGIDVAAAFGSPVVAADDGVVRESGWIRNGGYRVCVGHAGGLETCYFHLASPLVGAGQRVTRGQPIGLIGMSGLTRGPHVHWEAKLSGKLIDPLLR